MILRLGSALILIAAAAMPATAVAQGRTTYCCNEESGRQVCSDVLPQACYGKAYREINSRGFTVRRVDAPLTAEQRALKEAEAKKAKEEEIKRLEQDRRNRALLATYATEQDIDYARDRAIADVQRNIKASQEKQDELAKRKQQLDNEAEFYRKKAMPQQLQAQLRDVGGEMKAQQAVIERGQKEIEAIKVRYEDEKQRYRELTKSKSAGGGQQAAPPAPAGADARPH